jgi:putative membrane protein
MPYDNFDPREFIVRDWLALDRTILANERTFLAYGRTALTLFIAGLTFVKFFGHVAYAAIGYVFVLAGFVIFALGLRRYVRMMRHYRGLSVLSDEILPKELKKEFQAATGKIPAKVSNDQKR